MAQYRNLSIHVDKGNQTHVIGMSIHKRHALEAQVDFPLSSFASVMAPQMRSVDCEWGNSRTYLGKFTVALRQVDRLRESTAMAGTESCPYLVRSDTAVLNNNWMIAAKPQLFTKVL
jgi:hypothetical protein